MNSTPSANHPVFRAVREHESLCVEGGATYLDINLFGYSLAIGDEGFMVCNPGACVVVAWDALK